MFYYYPDYIHTGHQELCWLYDIVHARVNQYRNSHQINELEASKLRIDTAIEIILPLYRNYYLEDGNKEYGLADPVNNRYVLHPGDYVYVALEIADYTYLQFQSQYTYGQVKGIKKLGNYFRNKFIDDYY